MRGTRQSPPARFSEPRFIPACAGNARVYARAPCPWSVHPRVCGERAESPLDFNSLRGSSPRVRGTQALIISQGVEHRFIPACAGNAPPTILYIPPFPVHPRVCGERAMTLTGIMACIGSSPRVRGTRRIMERSKPCHRFIPACAGNAVTNLATKVWVTVHPRVCGERRRLPLAVVQKDGSSPRVRGTRGAGLEYPSSCRFIPACAGNAGHRGHALLERPVHPRVCGERESRRGSFRAVYGSSPRVRGTPGGANWVGFSFRFIPACAGNANAIPAQPADMTVHPRVCGERSMCRCGIFRLSGSSPRVRGTLQFLQVDLNRWRFIPACAGNAEPGRLVSALNSVHPRVCGERDGNASPAAVTRGSSPRVRGTRYHIAASDLRCRFIPACAGNASCRRVGRGWRLVHPRVCGERPAKRVATANARGSSPRVRGTHLITLPDGSIWRFIPACAGNAPSSERVSRRDAVHPRVCGERAFFNSFGSR